jgi:hypothetical protein
MVQRHSAAQQAAAVWKPWLSASTNTSKESQKAQLQLKSNGKLQANSIKAIRNT